MNLKTYFLNVVMALAATFIATWIFSEPFNGTSFAGALLGVFLLDYWKAGK